MMLGELLSVCRSCIVKYLETSVSCPICDTEIHTHRPNLNLRYAANVTCVGRPDNGLEISLKKLSHKVYRLAVLMIFCEVVKYYSSTTSICPFFSLFIVDGKLLFQRRQNAAVLGL